MCRHLDLGDGNFAIICGGHHKPKYCACGRESSFLCDWKMPGKKSGTCDAPICSKHALQVAPDKHLCPFHQHAWKDWQKRHVAPQDAQLSLLTTSTPTAGRDPEEREHAERRMERAEYKRQKELFDWT